MDIPYKAVAIFRWFLSGARTAKYPNPEHKVGSQNPGVYWLPFQVMEQN